MGALLGVAAAANRVLGDRLRAILDKRLLLPVLVLVVFFGFWLLLRPPSFPSRLRIGRGVDGGTWAELGSGLSRLLEDRLPDVRVEAERTEGSVDNVARLESREIDLAFLQNDTRADPSVRMITPFYDNILHIVVRADADPPIAEFTDLHGRRVAVGAPRSGTLMAARALLDHFGIESTEKTLDTEDSIDAFRNGQVDAVFVFAALPGSPLGDLLEDGRLLSLGVPGGVGTVAEGFCVTNPAFQPAVIPTKTYGASPPEAVGAISVKTILACRADLDPYLVYEIVRIVFAGKLELADSHPVAMRLRESFDPSTLNFSLHEGAATWFRRKDPPFYVRYADPLSLAFSIFLAAVSGLYALRQWIRRRRKNRIDAYYIEVGEVAAQIREASRDALRSLQARLDDIRRRAFEDLVRERVGADATFNIFLNFLQSQLRTIRNRLASLDRSA
jgi:TRAP transporter TAXI family solute receptor